jgi:hypothetical protein
MSGAMDHGPALDWTPGDRAALARARDLLEHPGLAMRLAHAAGTPFEHALTALPDGANEAIQKATHRSLHAALRLATSRMDERRRPAAARLHTAAVGAMGAVGGAFGFTALAAELPLTTTTILRSIAEIARSEGHAVRTPRVQLACLEVFALGGPGRGDDAAETGYFAVRMALAKAVAEAAEHLAARGVAVEGAPALVRLVTTIAARFGVPVTQKLLAQAVPILGAAAGAAINVVFMRHFQDVARGHFTVLRLEETYGAESVKRAYERA